MIDTIKLIAAIYIVGMVAAQFAVGICGEEDAEVLAYLWPLVLVMVMFVGMVHVVMYPGHLLQQAGRWVRNKYFPPKPQGDGPIVEE